MPDLNPNSAPDPTHRDTSRDFDMDGTTHEVPASDTGCCLTFGGKCPVPDCPGWMHYQAIYGGYYYKCECCGQDDDDPH